MTPPIDPSRTPPSAGGPVQAYLDALGPGSRRTIEQALGRIAGILRETDEADPHQFNWSAVDQPTVGILRRELAEQFAPATANKMLAALRGVMRVCRDQGKITEAQFQAAARFDRIKDFRAGESRVLSESELKRLFRACHAEGTAAGRRDAALLAIFLSTGLRREEAIELNLADYDPHPRPRKRLRKGNGSRPRSGTLHIRSDIAERDRVAELGEAACAAIDHWLDARGLLPGVLLLPVDRGGTIRVRRLTSQAVYGIVSRATQRAGLGHTTTRDLRRTCIVRLIRAGLDIDQVRQRVGHASWLTTAAYSVLAREAGKLKTADLPAEAGPPD